MSRRVKVKRAEKFVVTSLSAILAETPVKGMLNSWFPGAYTLENTYIKGAQV